AAQSATSAASSFGGKNSKEKERPPAASSSRRVCGTAVGVPVGIPPGPAAGESVMAQSLRPRHGGPPHARAPRPPPATASRPRRPHSLELPVTPHPRGAGGTAGMDDRPADRLDDRDPLDVERLRERLHEALDEFCARQARALAAVSPECAPLVETVAALI